MRIPKYSFHKGSGQARVRINGVSYYLGVYNSPSSRDKYHRLISEYIASGEIAPTDSPLKCADLVARFLFHAETHYRRKDGTDTGTTGRFRRSLNVMLDLFADSPAKDFTPGKLKRVRDAMVKSGWCRNTVNARTSLVRQVFAWGVSEDIVPSTVSYALEQVQPLEAGRTDAPETDPVKPVPENDIWKAQAKMPATVAAMVQLQYLTGMRTGEVCALRPVELLRDWPTKGIWTFKPSHHKTAHHEIERHILIGPRAQLILSPWLAGLQADDYVFRPADALPWRPKHRKSRNIGQRYRVDSYCRAVWRACKAAKVPEWSPGQLRHNALTRIASEFDRDTARLVGGHTTIGTTEHYIVDDLVKAAEAMKKAG